MHNFICHIIEYDESDAYKNIFRRFVPLRPHKNFALEATMDKSNNRPAEDCSDRKGSLPSCAPLSVPFVPFQSYDAELYSSAEALSKGTLFPGLDLPWKNVINRKVDTSTPLGELTALSFVIDELGLYLDTHPTDNEAYDLFRRYVELMKTGVERYRELYGPLLQTDIGSPSYAWLESPWPWEERGSN